MVFRSAKDEKGEGGGWKKNGHVTKTNQKALYPFE